MKMLKWVFKNRELSKIETWKKFELFELFNDLDKAEKLLTELIADDAENFGDAKEFHREFVEELNDLKHQNVPNFERICIWFLPTSSWDDIVGTNGMELANRIYDRAYKWNKVNH